MAVNGAQFCQVQAVTKLVQHFGIGQDALVAQESKLPPGPVFRQHLHEQIK